LQGGAAFTGNGQLNLNGASAYVNLPNGLVSGLTNVTFEFWVTWNGGNGVWSRVFDFGSNSNGEDKQGTGQTYLFFTPQASSSSGTCRFAISTNSAGGEMPVNGAAALPVGQETHVAVVYNFVAGIVTLYLNGQPVAIAAATTPLNAINDINDWIGRSNWS